MSNVPIQKQMIDKSPEKTKIRLIGFVIIQLKLFEICFDSLGNFLKTSPRIKEENVIIDK
jgi:hypothetical protein